MNPNEKLNFCSDSTFKKNTHLNSLSDKTSDFLISKKIYRKESPLKSKSRASELKSYTKID